MQMEKRFEDICKTTADTIFLDMLTDAPESLYVLDVRKNSEYWVNKGYLIFLNKKEKVLIGK